MRNRNKVLLFIIVLLAPHILLAQIEIPVKSSFLIEQIGLPTFQKYGGNLGYGLSIGSEYSYTKKKRIDFAQTADLYFYIHNLYGTTCILATQFDFRYKPGRFNVDFKLGPGYMMFYNFSPLYKEVNGEYKKASNLQSKFSAIMSVAVSYRIQNFRPFIAYNLITETPFINSISVLLPHQIIEIGCYYNVNLNRNEK